MREELHALVAIASARRTEALAGRDFHLGTIHGHPVLLVLSGIGKVAAATTATLALQAHGAHALVFTGVAGGLAPGVRVGDVVVADHLLQHDMDASPLFPRFEVPGTGRAMFDADAVLSGELAEAAARCIAAGLPAVDGQTTAGAARLHRGLVVSGDRFVASAAESHALRRLLPAALAVEMEGAAVAQVCHDFHVPCAVLRTVSDRADDSAHLDFGRFIAEVASVCTLRILGDWLARRAVT